MRRSLGLLFCCLSIAFAVLTPLSPVGANPSSDDVGDRFTATSEATVSNEQTGTWIRTPTAKSRSTGSTRVENGCKVYDSKCQRIDDRTCAPEKWTGKMVVHYDDQMNVTAVYAICTGDKTPTAPLPQVTGDLVLNAFRSIGVPKPTMTVQPPPGTETLVNIETVFSAEADPFQRTVTLLGQQVTLDIKPSSYSWTFGDGTSLTTKQPGRPVRAGEVEQSPLPKDLITHTYTAKSNVAVSLTVSWTATWSLNGGPFQPVPGSVTTATAPHPLEVLEARPLLVK